MAGVAFGDVRGRLALLRALHIASYLSWQVQHLLMLEHDLCRSSTL